MVRRGKPLQPTPAGDGLRPAGARDDEHPPAVRLRGNASLAGHGKCRARHSQSRPTSTALKPSPMRGRGTAPRWMRCQHRHRTLLFPCPTLAAVTSPQNKSLRIARPRTNAPLRERRRGEAHRRQGWVGGACPSAPLPARTAAFDGHCTFTRAARSAGLRFAVRSLSEVIDRENTLREGRRDCRSPHPPRSGPPSPTRGDRLRGLDLIHRKRSPFPS